mmetsp:Transcript_47327/g.120063  ORF Transcript_47327/g.120063 Transcript_47327/m.120063 type:complete len:220 (+) Transcript_47327:211-870(+)
MSSEAEVSPLSPAAQAELSARTCFCTAKMLGLALESYFKHASHNFRHSAPNGTSSGHSSSCGFRSFAAARISSALTQLRGMRPVISMYRSLPKEKTSALGAGMQPPPSMTSGAIQLSVPPRGPARFVIKRPRPKSTSFALQPCEACSTKTLEPLMSPWTMTGLWECKYLSAQHTSFASLHRSVVLGDAGGTRINVSSGLPRTYSKTRRISLLAELMQAP